MDHFKHYLLTFLISFSVFVFFHIFTLLFIDPLNISSFELSKNEFFIKEMRFQSASIINKYDFDSAIVGTSMAANFKASEANDKLGGRFQNLSLDGSLLTERKVLLDYLLAKKNIKTLIISIDGATELQRNKGIPIEAWSFLYNNNRLDDFKLYINRKYTPYISCNTTFNNNFSNLMFGECPKHKITKKLKNLTEWQSNPNHNSRFGGIEKWLEFKENTQVSKLIEYITTASTLIQKRELRKYIKTEKLYDPNEFSKNIVPLLVDYPKTRFILFFPPYSIFKYAIDIQTNPDIYLQYKELVKRVVLETELYSNAEVYWFADKDFVKNIVNYKDLTHYSADYNSLFLEHFRLKHSLIDVKNYNKLLSDLENEAQTVNLIDLAKKLNHKQNLQLKAL